MTRGHTARDVSIGAALVAAVAVVYWPALHGTLLWDDAGHITRPDLRPLSGLWRIWFEVGATQQYYPLLHSAFWLEHRLWGDSVLGYHLVNVLLHAGSALLLRGLLAHFGLRGAWIAAWIFALHPMQVESVAWISEQKNTLSTFFYLASALAYVKFDAVRSISTYGAATLLFVAGMASKTTSATLPAALLVVMWWSRGTLALRRDVLPLMPWLVIAAVGGALTAWFEHRYIGATGSDFDLTIGERVLLAGRAVIFYASTFAWPVDLSFNYPRWEIDGTRWWQYLFPLAVGLAVGAAWRVRRQHRGPLAAVLLYIGALFPALGFVNVYPFVYSYVANHFAYLSVVALSAMVPWVLFSTAESEPPGTFRTRLAPVLAGALVVALGWATWRESGTYRNVETLYRTTIARNPSSWMAIENLGVLLTAVRGRMPEAAALFEAAVRIRPDAQRRRNLALALANLSGREPEAAIQFEQLIRMGEARPSDRVTYGRVLRRISGRSAEALAQFRQAVELSPDDADAHYALANALTHDPVTAEQHYRQAITLHAGFAEAHYNLGNLLARQPGRLVEARREYRVALAIRPDYAAAHYNLGTALLDEPHRNLDAVAHLTAAVLLRPDDARARTHLALALADQPGRADDAVRQLDVALRLDPSLPQPRRLLALLQRFPPSTAAAP